MNAGYETGVSGIPVMTEEELIARLAENESSGKPVWVSGGISKGVAIGVDADRGVIILRGGGTIPLKQARFVVGPW